MGLCLNLSLASEITHLLVSYVVCPITNLVKNSYFISDIIPIFFLQFGTVSQHSSLVKQRLGHG